ncbi:AAA family ATPase [Candidatus Acetothermia bacterium]|nr:MAG: AAA family ATPase [Candidatus Acetothermia bacterium]
MFKRPMYHELKRRLQEPRRFIQVLAGARQTGKTTLVQQVLADLSQPSHYASADEPTLKDPVWIEQQWEVARRLVSKNHSPAVLVLDEVQKIPNWSEIVKRLWDEDTRTGLPLHVVLLGSAPLLMQRGLSESLAGRFEVIHMPHWSFAEMHEAFGWSLDQYVYYGGYPGSAPLISEPERWRQYILDSLIETTISRDILLLHRVDKPALLRRLFELGCQYSGQVLSYNKMLGQLQNAGNTTTLAHYLDLLKAAGLLEGLQKYAGQRVRQRASSPKLQVHNNALMTAQLGVPYEEAREDGRIWGRLVESAVGMWLVNATRGTPIQVYYWASGNREVDFVLAKGSKLVAIEVKSAYRTQKLRGMEAFAREFKVHKMLLVGGDGIPIEEFISTDPASWF